MVIDTHAHIIVPEITRSFGPTEQWRPEVFWKDNRQVIDFNGKQITSAVYEFVHIDAILEAQQAAGVDHVVLCPWVSTLRYDADLAEGLRASHIQNEALSRLAQAHPGKVSALGSVPMQDPQVAARELETLMKEPGLYGVEVAASVNGEYLGGDQFLPFWAAAEECGAFVFIHPTTRGFKDAVFNDYYLWNSVGNPLETTVTAAHMVMAGVMEAHPQLKVLLAHGGGAILSLTGRLRHAHSFQPQARSRLKESPIESLKRFYYDTVTHDAGLLQQVVDFAGVDHVLLGSDYPFDMGAYRPAEIVRQLGLPPDEEEKIISGNAKRVLGLRSE